MKKIKEISFILDVDDFVEEYGLTVNSTKEDILDCLDDYLCGCDDSIYYTFSVDEVYEEYKDKIIESAKNHKLNLLKCFNEICGNAVMSGRLIAASDEIRKILEQYYSIEDETGIEYHKIEDVQINGKSINVNSTKIGG